MYTIYSMLYYRMKVCHIKSCLSEKGRFFILNCVRFHIQGVRVTGGNLFHLLISCTPGIQGSMGKVTEATGKLSGINEGGRGL